MRKDKKRSAAMRNKSDSPHKRSKLSDESISPSSNYSAESDGDSVGVSSISEPLTGSPPSNKDIDPSYLNQVRPIPGIKAAKPCSTLEQELSRPYFPLFLGKTKSPVQESVQETRKLSTASVNSTCLPALQYSAMANIGTQLRLEHLTRMSHLLGNHPSQFATHSTSFPTFPFKQRPLAERLYLEALKSKTSFM